MGTFPPGDIVACIPLLVIGDENFEGEEMFSISIYETGPDFSLPLASGREMGNITLRDPEGELATHYCLGLFMTSLCYIYRCSYILHQCNFCDKRRRKCNSLH